MASFLHVPEANCAQCKEKGKPIGVLLPPPLPLTLPLPCDSLGNYGGSLTVLFLSNIFVMMPGFDFTSPQYADS